MLKQHLYSSGNEGISNDVDLSKFLHFTDHFTSYDNN